MTIATPPVEQNKFIELEERICFDLLNSQILGPSGEHPRCLGRQCSKFENCLANIYIAWKDVSTVSNAISDANGGK